MSGRRNRGRGKQPKGLYEKELQEIRTARERFLKGAMALYQEDGSRRYPDDEFDRRAADLLERFEVVARKLLRKAERDAENQRKILTGFPQGAEVTPAKRARLRLRAAELLEEGVSKVRKEINGLAKKDDAS